MDYLLLVIGFVLLIKGADFFVDGSSSIAKRLRVPSIIIGLTIVGITDSTKKNLEMRVEAENGATLAGRGFYQ